jgi:ketosteroid isomerase-like protein
MQNPFLVNRGDNVDIVRRSFQALARGDFEAAFADHAPDIEWRTASDEPDSQTYRGIDGLRRLVAAVAEPWENRFDGSVELEESISRGPWVVVPWRARLHGRGSGLEIEVFETYAVLVRAGKIARVEEYRTTEEALQALPAHD